LSILFLIAVLLLCGLWSILRVANDDRIDLPARKFPPDVGIDDIQQVYAYGVLYAARALWEELGIGPLLREQMQQDRCEAPHETALFAMTANRRRAAHIGVTDQSRGLSQRGIAGLHLLTQGQTRHCNHRPNVKGAVLLNQRRQSLDAPDVDHRQSCAPLAHHLWNHDGAPRQKRRPVGAGQQREGLFHGLWSGITHARLPQLTV
jgi:hypothetical protein